MEDYRVEEPAAYTSLDYLYSETSALELNTLEDELSRKCTLKDLILSEEDLREYLKQEARLRIK